MKNDRNNNTLKTDQMAYRVEIYEVSKIPKDIKSIIENDYQSEDCSSEYNEIYEEQLIYINADAPDSYFIAAFNNDIYIGGVVLFLDTVNHDSENGGVYIDTPSPGFQAIVKSQKGILDPIKLNSLLIPAIVNFLSNKNYENVYVHPLFKQRKILIEHYNFLKYDNNGVLYLKI